MRKSIIIAVLAAFAAASCTGNFESYNRNPDQPSSMDRDVWDYLVSMQYTVLLSVKNQYQITENLSGGAYGRYFAYAQSTAKGWNTNMFAYYQVSGGYANDIFERNMTNVYSNLRAIIEALDNAQDDYRMALAQILRVAVMQRLTDIQGPIPYRTMENTTSITAAYESQEDVYGYMFDDLDEAIASLDRYLAVSGSEVPEEIDNRDHVYGGDLAKWIRFANSLKLRMAMRISYVSPTLAQQQAEAAVSNVYGVMSSNADNAAIDFSNTNDQNPLWWLVFDYQDVHAAAEIVTYLKSFADPRLAAYFSPAADDNQYHGSRVGVHSASAWLNYYSRPKVSKTDRIMWMNAAETAFLKAEMALNGWTVPGTAQELYEEGIKLSFDQYGVGGYAAYIADATSKPGYYSDPQGTHSYSGATYDVTIAWDDALGTEKLREKIITQKWFALYPLGTEAWSEQRRTGYPRFYPSPGIFNLNTAETYLSTQGPSRLPFAPDEVTRNDVNYAAAVTLLGGPDIYGTRLWWDVKTDKPVW